MNTPSHTSHIPFRELPSQARGLLFIFAIGALAAFGTKRPGESELTPALEIIWNWNRLRLDDLSNPGHMTHLLTEHFGLLRAPKLGPQ